jgi:hypothetical protein
MRVLAKSDIAAQWARSIVRTSLRLTINHKIIRFSLSTLKGLEYRRGLIQMEDDLKRQRRDEAAELEEELKRAKVPRTTAAASASQDFSTGATDQNHTSARHRKAVVGTMRRR